MEERNNVLVELKEKLQLAKNRRKQYVDENRTEVEYNVGD